MAPLPPYLLDIQREIEGHARGYGLDFWNVELEILDYKKMQEVAAFGGFPVRYPHWRFGMEFEHLAKSHIYGFSKIYEMVINNDPPTPICSRVTRWSIRRLSSPTCSGTSTSSRTTTSSPRPTAG